MKVLVTGAAGFIGHAVSKALIARGDTVVGIDNLNDYYDVQLKLDRLADIGTDGFDFLKLDFADDAAFDATMADVTFDHIVHLGAQAGVRYSLENPRAYARSNVAGHLNLLELARQRAVPMVYASSSSVYGGNEKMPFSVDDRVDHPVSLYAATKKADELMSETYAHLYRIPLTGLRFFTVYGPWGRPDMAPWLFTKAILAGEPIKVFNHGNMRRDFTYIDDIVTGVLACVDNPPADDGHVKPGGSVAPHALYNIGNNRPEELIHFIEILERATGKTAIRELLPMQPGDVPATYADVDALARDTAYAPTIPLEVGLPQFVGWFRSRYGV
ncbi:MAG: NAD-dependent epimerase/dehydratase family protein [Pseudomonadota bacterium]